MHIWPAIQIRNGQCMVSEPEATGSSPGSPSPIEIGPLELARRWIGEGATQLHLVDLDAAQTPCGAPVERHNRDLIIALIRAVEVPCQVGGGLRTEEDLDRFVQAGAARLVCGTRAIADRTWIYEMCHLYPGRMVAAIDSREGLVSTEGRRGQTSVRAIDLARELSLYPLQGIICTDVDRDGTLSGPNVESLMMIARSVAIPVIAAGGIASSADIRRLSEIGIDGCLLDQALHHGALPLAEALATARGTGPPAGDPAGRRPAG